MDINTLRVAVTVASFITFIGIVIWAYSSGPRKAFAEAAQLPFLDDAQKHPFSDHDDHRLADAEARR